MRVFLAAPFTAKVMSSAGGTRLDSSFSTLIAAILSVIRKYDIEAFSSHEREQWGANIYEPSRALREDLAELRRCDLVLAIIGDPPSPGVQMELGYSLALEMPIVCFFRQPFDALPHLVKGFGEGSRAVLVQYGSDDELIAALSKGAQQRFSQWMDAQDGGRPVETSW